MVRKLNILTIFIVSTFLFACAYFVSNITSQLLFINASNFAFLKQVTFKTILAIVSVMFGIFVFKVPVSEFSLLQNKKQVNSRIYLLIAIILGAIATLCMQVFDFPRVKLLAQLSPIEIIIAVWGFSTVCEEIFCRGLVQNLVIDQRTCYSIAGIIISKPVLIGAAVFGLMHSTIYFSGGSGYTAIGSFHFHGIVARGDIGEVFRVLARYPVESKRCNAATDGQCNSPVVFPTNCWCDVWRDDRV